MSGVMARVRQVAAEHPNWPQWRLAEEVGCPPGTVSKALYPERAREVQRRCNAKRIDAKRAYDREYDRTHKGVCSDCGGATGRNSKTNGCRACIASRADETARELERLWRAGWAYPEICAHFGWTLGHLSARIARCRSLGYDLPHRYRVKSQVA